MAETAESLSISGAIREGAASLRAAGIENPRLEARLLLAHAAGLTGEALLIDPERTLDRDAAARFRRVVGRRAARAPLAHITGVREFWSLPFRVNAATLIPRPDSETLIEVACRIVAERARVRRILDLGTGSGCLLIAALSEFPGARGLGIDIDPKAAAMASENARRLGVLDRALFRVADWAEGGFGAHDLILCNPPYIETAALDRLQPEVARYDPRRALDGGDDGLAAYRRVLPVIAAALDRGGLALVELGAGQAEAVTSLAAGAGLETATVECDLGGIPRALVLETSAGARSAPENRGKKPLGKTAPGV